MCFEKLCLYPLIDVRSSDDFAALHITNSTNIPASELEERMNELPIKTTPLNLFGKQNELVAAAQFLVSKGYHVVDTLQANENSLYDLKKSQWGEMGSISKRLWQPAAVVGLFVEKYADLSVNKSGLDIACGSGRDSVFMCCHGWSMTGVDYSSTALEKMRRLAEFNQQQVSSILIDLEKNFAELLASNQTYGAVIVVRYLHRPALEAIKQLIDKNGFIIYQTFMKGSEKFGSPKNPRFLLETGELGRVFSDFNIIVDEIKYLSDGRPTNIFIAQKV